jgi:hypothetical protein
MLEKHEPMIKIVLNMMISLASGCTDFLKRTDFKKALVLIKNPQYVCKGIVIIPVIIINAKSIMNKIQIGQFFNHQMKAG